PIDLIETANLSTANIEYKFPTHSLSAYDSYVTVSNDANKANQSSNQSIDKIKNFQDYLSTLSAAKWQFFGDSLTYAGVQTWGYKGYVDYLRWILENEFNRQNDIFLNQGVLGARYVKNSNKYGEYSYPELSFKNYPTDVLYVAMGTNDVTTNQNNAAEYITDNITQVYNDFKETNKNGWMIVSTIPYFYSNTTSMINIVDKANEAIKVFATNKEDVIFIDNNNALNNVITQKLQLTTDNGASYFTPELYASDKIHFNTNAYIIITKNILSNLNFDYSKSQFMQF
ncbi:MAG: SGNH/GDSL hydrolase family protein, partial [Malacoplasma sp.]|nr:SGNH/GDSL hydrolase family protein [Malacoplasma sp.]